MNYGELRDYFKQVLNRNDITDTLADQFIGMGLRRTERKLRTPLQKSVLKFTVPAAWNGNLGVPMDYLSINHMKVNDLPIARIPAGFETDPLTGDPRHYYITEANFNFRPSLKEGDKIQMEYYNEFAQGVTSDTFTNYSVVIPDLITYAALVYAADYYTDSRKADFAEAFTVLFKEVQDMAELDELSGGVAVRNPYEGIV